MDIVIPLSASDQTSFVKLHEGLDEQAEKEIYEPKLSVL